MLLVGSRGRGGETLSLKRGLNFHLKKEIDFVTFNEMTAKREEDRVADSEPDIILALRIACCVCSSLSAVLIFCLLPTEKQKKKSI